MDFIPVSNAGKVLVGPISRLSNAILQLQEPGVFLFFRFPGSMLTLPSCNRQVIRPVNRRIPGLRFCLRQVR